MQECWERSPVIEVVPCMHALVSDSTFPWTDWCEEMRRALNVQPVPTCMIHSPHEVMRLAWAAAFRIPNDETTIRHFYDNYDDSTVELVMAIFPFMSGFSCAWFIDRMYRYMGRNDVHVKQVQADESCMIGFAPTVCEDLFSQICQKITMGNVNAANTFSCWLRACALRPDSPRPVKLVLKVGCHLDEQSNCHFDESAQRLCTSIARQIRTRSIKIRYTPIIQNGLPAYVLFAFLKS